MSDGGGMAHNGGSPAGPGFPGGPGQPGGRPAGPDARGGFPGGPGWQGGHPGGTGALFPPPPMTGQGPAPAATPDWAALAEATGLRHRRGQRLKIAGALFGVLGVGGMVATALPLRADPPGPPAPTAA
ncbi:hypothetical protein ACFQMG_15620, partial [Kitasatospora paranensis]